MFLTKLELVGFKSFAAKTVLEFPRGITAIVGPNGSGKSNIIDAIRWLLGERDAKNLRGGKGEDLIFAGTPSRARMGMAQAALYFDNTSKFFPVDYEEVSITRQVNREGISQYYLNKAEVRLKDVVDFFAHSRLGTKGLIIIGQGQSDIFIRATPQERREMVEEILGLRQFQLKKNEAERKLRHTLDNAEKVSALIEEIAPHLRLLKRQTAKWERRAEIAAELRGLEMAYFAHKIRNLKRELRELEPRAASLEHTLLAAQEEFKAAQDKLKKAQAEQIPEQKESEKIMQLEQELQAKHSTLERELARSEARLEYLEKQDAGDSLDVNTLKSVLKNIEAKLEKALSFDFDALRLAVREVLLNIKELFKRGLMRESKTEMSRLKKEIVVLKEELSKLNNEIEKLRLRRKELLISSQNVHTLLGEMLAVFEKKKDDIARLENEKNKVNLEIEHLKLKLQDIKHEAEQLGYSFEELEEGAQTSVDSLGTEMEKRMLRLRGELASIGDVDEALVREAAETEKRYIFLTAQLEDLKKASNDLKVLIRSLEETMHREFEAALKAINEEFQRFFHIMFGGGRARLVLKLLKEKARESSSEADKVRVKEEETKDEEESIFETGLEIELSMPRKKISGLEMLSGGERSLVSIAALFALIAVSPPPFLVLDEIDAALDERNAKTFARLVKDFAQKTQFIIVTHNRATMEAADVLYGVTMAEDGTSKVVSLRLEK